MPAKPPSYNHAKENFHAIVEQKKRAGMPGNQAIAHTYAQAFPGQSVYKPAALNPSERKNSPFRGISPKAPKAGI